MPLNLAAATAVYPTTTGVTAEIVAGAVKQDTNPPTAGINANLSATAGLELAHRVLWFIAGATVLLMLYLTVNEALRVVHRSALDDDVVRQAAASVALPDPAELEAWRSGLAALAVPATANTPAPVETDTQQSEWQSLYQSLLLSNLLDGRQTAGLRDWQAGARRRSRHGGQAMPGAARSHRDASQGLGRQHRENASVDRRRQAERQRDAGLPRLLGSDHAAHPAQHAAADLTALLGYIFGTQQK
jgi:hypothetical protein